MITVNVTMVWRWWIDRTPSIYNASKDIPKYGGGLYIVYVNYQNAARQEYLGVISSKSPYIFEETEKCICRFS